MPTPKNPFHRRSAAIERLGQTAVAIQRLWIRPSRFVIPPFQFVTPSSQFVIPALSRDPSHAVGLCKGQRCSLDVIEASHFVIPALSRDPSHAA
jgi:hypothetical protein